MRLSKAEYVKRLLIEHIQRYFYCEKIGINNRLNIEFFEESNISTIKECKIYIPWRLELENLQNENSTVKFNKTEISKPNTKMLLPIGWYKWPLEGDPIWFLNSTGAQIIPWITGEEIYNLITDEIYNKVDKKDKHNRISAIEWAKHSKFSRIQPIINEIAALIVSGLLAIKRGHRPQNELPKESVRPVEIGLSHDLDQLRGDDFWTQVARLRRVIKSPRNFKYIIYSQLNPYKYYRDNIKNIIQVEKKYNFTSTFYFLNGTKGRFGSRSSIDEITEARRSIPLQWGVGIHYNFDTFDNPIALKLQLQELQKKIKSIELGRAHYLKFNPNYSYYHWNSVGIKIDESLGFNDEIGYRGGIAGLFNPVVRDFGNSTIEISKLIESPLIIMDSNLLKQSNVDWRISLRQILEHLNCIGGRITYLLHCDFFDNPEYIEFFGHYDEFLSILSQYRVVNMPAHVILQK
jgi:hypothetical protein